MSRKKAYVYPEWCEMHGQELTSLDDCYICENISYCNTHVGYQFKTTIDKLKEHQFDTSNVLTIAQIIDIKGFSFDIPYVPYTRPSACFLEWLYRESKKNLSNLKLLIEWFPIWRRIDIGQE